MRARAAAARCRRLLCLALCLALCMACAPGENFSRAEGVIPNIRVLLRRLALAERADLYLSGRYGAACDGTELALRDGVHVAALVREGEIYLAVDGVTLRAGKKAVFTRYASDARETGIRFAEGGNIYPGDLTLTVSDGALQPVLTLPVEDYLLGVVPNEMNESFPLEALKAQAVCARTYALSHRDPSKAWDVVDTTNDQVFRGIDRTNTRSAQAVRDTAGVVGMYNGQLATCYYGASNGGQTELPEHVWGGRDAPRCYAVTDDPYDLANPESPVKRARLYRDGSGLSDAMMELLFAKLKPEMEEFGFCTSFSVFLRVDGITSVSLGGRKFAEPNRLMTTLTLGLRWSGRVEIHPQPGDEEEIFLYDTPAPGTPAEDGVILTDFIPSGRESTVTLPLFGGAASALNLLLGTTGNELITVREEEKAFVLESRRFGHGVGMSQRGAQWMAAQYGKSFDQILDFYYPGMKLMVGGTTAAALPAAPARLFADPGPAPTPTPRPTLMPVTAPLPAGAYLASVEGIAEDSSLNLRAEPNSGAEVRMRLLPHQRLVVLEICEDPIWAHVRTDVIEGYVMVSFLEKVK